MPETIQPQDLPKCKIIEDRSRHDSQQATVTVRADTPVPMAAIDDLRSSGAAAIAADWAHKKLGRCGHTGMPWPIALDLQMERIPGDQLLKPTTVVGGYEVEFTFNAFNG